MFPVQADVLCREEAERVNWSHCLLPRVWWRGPVPPRPCHARTDPGVLCTIAANAGACVPSLDLRAFESVQRSVQERPDDPVDAAVFGRRRPMLHPDFPIE